MRRIPPSISPCRCTSRLAPQIIGMRRISEPLAVELQWGVETGFELDHAPGYLSAYHLNPGEFHRQEGRLRVHGKLDASTARGRSSLLRYCFRVPKRTSRTDCSRWHKHVLAVGCPVHRHSAHDRNRPSVVPEILASALWQNRRALVGAHA